MNMTRDETIAAYNQCKSKERLICGGLRSGKTYLAAHTVLARLGVPQPIVVVLVATNERCIAYLYKNLEKYGLYRLPAKIMEIAWNERTLGCPQFMRMANGTELNFFTSTETWPFDVDVLWIDNEVNRPDLLPEWRSTVKEDGLFIWSQWNWTDTQEARELWLSHPESQFVLSILDNPGLSQERVNDIAKCLSDKTRLYGKHP